MEALRFRLTFGGCEHLFLGLRFLRGGSHLWETGWFWTVALLAGTLENVLLGMQML